MIDGRRAAPPPPAHSRVPSIPVVRVDGRICWLTPDQWALYRYVRQRVRGAGPVTVAATAAVFGWNTGRITERLDRLAALGLIGRRSRVGRGHRTLLWIPRRGRLLYGADRARWLRSGNVRTPTNYVGISTAYARGQGWHGAGEPSGVPPDPPDGGPAPGNRRRRTQHPPPQLWDRCPRGHRRPLRIAASSTDRRELRARWVGRCRRCADGAPERLELALTLTAGNVRTGIDWPELEARHGPDRAEYWRRQIAVDELARRAADPRGLDRR